jgi:hypothetical protein
MCYDTTASLLRPLCGLDAGEYLDRYDPARDLARLRSVKVDDFRTRRCLEQEWQKALEEALALDQLDNLHG